MTRYSNKDILAYAVNGSVIALCLSLSVNMFTTGIAQKAFYIIGYISFFAVIYTLLKPDERVKFNKLIVIFISSLVILSLVRLSWGLIFSKSPAPLTPSSAGIVEGYLVGGKRMIIGSFIILFLYTHGNMITNKVISISKAILIAGLIITLAFGLHEHFYTINERIKLTADAASSSSYMIMFIYCAYLWLSLANKSLTWKLLTLFTICLTFALLILCDTRITLLAFMIITAIFFIKEYKIKIFKNPRTQLITLAIIATLLIVTGSRWVEGINDVKDYKENSSTSIGARIAIWDSGLYFIKHHSGFSSADERTKVAREFIKENHPNNLEGYTNVQYNMHNEFLEVITLQGWLGLVTLLLVYLCATLEGILKRTLNGIKYPLIALFIMGLSDSVIIYSQTATLFVMALALCAINIHKQEV